MTRRHCSWYILKLTDAFRKAILRLLSEHDFIKKLTSLLTSSSISEEEETIAERVLYSVNFDKECFEEKKIKKTKRTYRRAGMHD